MVQLTTAPYRRWALISALHELQLMHVDRAKCRMQHHISPLGREEDVVAAPNLVTHTLSCFHHGYKKSTEMTQYWLKFLGRKDLKSRTKVSWATSLLPRVTQLPPLNSLDVNDAFRVNSVLASFTLATLGTSEVTKIDRSFILRPK